MKRVQHFKLIHPCPWALFLTFAEELVEIQRHAGGQLTKGELTEVPKGIHFVGTFGLNLPLASFSIYSCVLMEMREPNIPVMRSGW